MDIKNDFKNADYCYGLACDLHRMMARRLPPEHVPPPWDYEGLVYGTSTAQKELTLLEKILLSYQQQGQKLGPLYSGILQEGLDRIAEPPPEPLGNEIRQGASDAEQITRRELEIELRARLAEPIIAEVIANCRAAETEAAPEL